MSFESRKWIVINMSDITDEMISKSIQSGDLTKNINEDKVKNFLTLILEELKSLIIIRRNANVTQDLFLPDEINLLKLKLLM